MDKRAEDQSLSVAMFPWIPDSAGDNFTNLWSHYETDFESQYEGIDVSVTTGDGSYYDATVISNWLTNGTFDVIEIDMVMLGDVIQTGAIQPFWDEDIASRFYPSSVQSVQLNDAYWGVPHLMCTYYLLSRDSTVASATNFSELNAALTALPDGQKFSGNLSAGWDSTALYIESFYQQDMGSPEGAVVNPVFPPVLGNLHQLALMCQNSAGDNPCTNGYYDTNWNQAAIDFAEGNVATSFGYSERLWVVLTQTNVVNQEDILISALQMGSTDKQLLFTDAFVVSANCTGPCLDAALDWVDYITTRDALGYMLASGDAGAGAVPRYLLPANLDALNYGDLPSDPFYPQYIDALVTTSPQPSADVPEFKDDNEDKIALIIANGP